MIDYKLLSMWVVAVTMVVPAGGANGRNAITTGQIAAAITNAGVTITAKQVTLLTEVVARTNSPALRVESMGPMGGNRMKVRLDCANSEDCVPFYVTIDGKGEGAVHSLSAAAPDQAPFSVGRPKSEAVTPLVRAGSVAILLLEGDHVRIQLPVICLENGSIGQTIRVTSKDRRQTYAAQVSDGGSLRGKL